MRRATTIRGNAFVPEKYVGRNILLGGTNSAISNKGVIKNKTVDSVIHVCQALLVVGTDGPQNEADTCPQRAHDNNPTKGLREIRTNSINCKRIW